MSKMTQQGYEQLKKELEILEKEERPAIAKILKEAISQGDLSENFAYQDGKARQEKLEERIMFLREEIKNATVEKAVNFDEVEIGNKITLQKDNQEKIEYIITGQEEADPSQNKISYQSPIGEALMHKKLNEEIQVSTPSKKITYRIIKIK